MNLQIVKDALYYALTLMNDEVESVELPELRDEYCWVIEKIEEALKEMNDREINSTICSK
ncbi:hypothetical protein [Mucilaginibacter flavus]|uniref:hypothetical protein n=1 Tax=Mucilaginibacter flavus TaxID=931504 RepID=UPI0025B35259|nr:hypothetical protein [Mucilaginibacter flavus]MDN3581920.1 hypothetical protein [Mucilaginibacter flavus]